MKKLLIIKSPRSSCGVGDRATGLVTSSIFS